MKQSECEFKWSCTCGRVETRPMDIVGDFRDCPKCKKHLEYDVTLSEPIDRKEILKVRYFGSKENAIEYSELQQKYWRRVIICENTKKIIRFGYNGNVKTRCPRVCKTEIK